MRHTTLTTLASIAALMVSATTALAQSQPLLAVSDSISVKKNGRIDASTGSESISTNSIALGKINVKDSGVIACDVFVGPGGSPATVLSVTGGAQFTGVSGVLSSPVSITAPSAPNLGASVGDLLYKGGVTTISSDIHCKKFKVKHDAIIQISGAVTMVVDDEFEFEDESELQLQSGASLTLYINKKLKLKGANTLVNVSSADPSRLVIYVLGNEKVDIGKNSVVYATIVAPGSELKVKDDAVFHGSFLGKKVNVDKRGRIILTSLGSQGAELLAHYRFDEASGLTAADSSGYGHDGSLQLSDSDEWTPGVVGTGAFTFDGVDDYVKTADASSLLISGDYTTAFWINAQPSQKMGAGIYAKTDAAGSANHWSLGFNTQAARYLVVSHSGFLSWTTTTSLADIVGAWRHIAIARSGTTMTLYVDGVAVETGTFAAAPVAAAGHLVIGADRTGYSSSVFAGQLDDLRIYGRALDAEEIQALFQGVSHPHRRIVAWQETAR